MLGKHCYLEYNNTVHEFTISCKCRHDGIRMLSLGLKST